MATHSEKSKYPQLTNSDDIPKWMGLIFWPLLFMSPAEWDRQMNDFYDNFIEPLSNAFGVCVHMLLGLVASCIFIVLYVLPATIVLTLISTPGLALIYGVAKMSGYV